MSGEMLSDLAPFPIRADLDRAYARAWKHLAGPGTWWDGARRLAMVEACREAPDCALCRERAASLSPFASTEPTIRRAACRRMSWRRSTGSGPTPGG